MKIALLALLATADLATGQCVQRAPLARLPAAEVVAVQAVTPTVFQTVLVPVAAFEFRWTGAVAGGYAAGGSQPPLAPPAPGPTSSAPASDFWPEAVAATAARPDPVAAILRQNCDRCHSFPTSRAGVHVLDSAGAVWSAIDRRRVAKAVREQRMPPGSPLTPQEINLIESWARAR